MHQIWAKIKISYRERLSKKMKNRINRQKVFFNCVKKEFQNQDKTTKFAISSTIIVSLISLNILLFSPGERDIVAFSTLLSGYGAVCAFIWVAASLSVQRKDLKAQIQARDFEIALQYYNNSINNADLHLRLMMKNLIGLKETGIEPIDDDFDLYNLDYIPALKMLNHANLRQIITDIYYEDGNPVAASFCDRFMEIIDDLHGWIETLEISRSPMKKLLEKSPNYRVYSIIKSAKERGKGVSD